MEFDPGFDIVANERKMTFSYGDDVFGPAPEIRRLDAIRRSLRDPRCTGPEIAYSIVMDVGRKEDRADLERRMLLYGAVIYSAGTFGREPVRSQGHVHAISASCGERTPEVYEIWDGSAIVYMQESAEDDPGRCFAVKAGPGQVVIVPPGWAHMTVNADPTRPMAFGAWCVRDYGFDYDVVRRHGGLAWFPIVEDDGSIGWDANDAYGPSEIMETEPRGYEELGLEQGVAVYRQYEDDHERFDFVADPKKARVAWSRIEP